MHFRSHDIEIDQANPFQNDLLKREQYAKVLTQIVKAVEDGCTLSIDGNWGCGKTTFVRMWRQMLINEGFYTIYLNAWETDFAQDPMMALMDSIVQSIKTTNFKKEKYQILSPIVGGLIELVKTIPGVSWVGNIAEGVKKTIDATQEDKDPLNGYRTYSSFVKEFQQKLQEFTEKIPNNKLIIFVDELDRCRPNYAIEMLERVKHLFSIPNIVFIISIDKTVILESIKGFYNSSEVNAENYLRRFIDLSFQLPQPSISDFVEAQYQYHKLEMCEDSYRNFLNNTYHGRNNHSEKLADIIKCLTISRRSLRDIEKFFNLLDIVLHSINKRESNIDVVVWLVYTYIFSPKVYQQLKVKEKNESEMILFLEKDLFGEYKSEDLDTDIYISYILCLLAGCYCRSKNTNTMTIDEIKNFSYEHIDNTNFPNVIQSAHNNTCNWNLQNIMQQIEMIDSHFSAEKETSNN